MSDWWEEIEDAMVWTWIVDGVADAIELVCRFGAWVRRKRKGDGEL